MKKHRQFKNVVFKLPTIFKNKFDFDYISSNFF